MKELTLIETKAISGGGVYEIGYAIGAACAETVDFCKGFINGLFN